MKISNQMFYPGSFAGDGRSNTVSAASEEGGAGGSSVKNYQVFWNKDAAYTGGNGSGLSFYLEYAKESTKENPVMTAKGVDENGKEFEQTININQVDPKRATYVEMTALEACASGDKLWLSPLNMNGCLSDAGINDRNNYVSEYQKRISDFYRLGLPEEAEKRQQYLAEIERMIFERNYNLQGL